MLITRKRRTVKEQRQREDVIANFEKLQATVEYVAAMQDIDIETEENEMEGEE